MTKDSPRRHRDRSDLAVDSSASAIVEGFALLFALIVCWDGKVVMSIMS